jgi:glutaredoxin
MVGHAEIYKWIDADGNVQFGDRPPASIQTETVEVRPNTYQSVTIEPFEAYSSKPTAAKGQVVMYSASWCGVCKKAKRYFQANKIPFQDYDVETTAKGKVDYAKLNGRGVPIILVGDRRMNGFSEQGFERIYAGGS